MGRNFVQRYPSVMACQTAVFDTANHHKGSDIHGNEAIGNHRQDGGGKEKTNRPSQNAEYKFHIKTKGRTRNVNALLIKQTNDY